MEINAARVKQLREMTGLPMMDCKKALTEASGDFDAAIVVLRKSGAGKMEKLAGRETSQGRVVVHIDPAANRGAIIELRCETAPVANTEDFQRLARLLAQTAARLDQPTPETLLEAPNPEGGKLIDVWHEVVNKLRENMQLANVAALTGTLGSYVHHDGQSGALAEFSAPAPDDLRTGVCMHIVSIKPPYLRREDVDAATIAKERDILKSQVPPDKAKMADKIVDGKVNKWLAEMCLLEQPYVKDDKQTVGQVLKAASPALTVTRFVRMKVGGA
jgi:elongation factor Ts